MDISCYHNGYHGDLNETMFVGNVDEDSKMLVKTAYDSMIAGLDAGILQEGAFSYYVCTYGGEGGFIKMRMCANRTRGLLSMRIFGPSP